jgi:hypothetical protein
MQTFTNCFEVEKYLPTEDGLPPLGNAEFGLGRLNKPSCK